MKKIQTNLIILFLIGCITLGNAQLKTPQPSPFAMVKQTVGLTEVTIEYSRPGKKDRKIFGELVPFGTIWRTGANKATSINVNDDVKIAGNDVPKGKYSMFTIPGETEWTIIINKNTELWGEGGYKQEEDLCRFNVKPVKTTDLYETFTIDFTNLSASGASVYLVWENTKVSFDIEYNSNQMVEKQIKELLIDGPSAGTYYGAAKYYLDNNKDLTTALDWINKAVEKRPEAFWYIHYKAQILAKLGKNAEAKTAAEQSIAKAKESKDGDYGYIKMNEDFIKTLK